MTRQKFLSYATSAAILLVAAYLMDTVRAAHARVRLHEISMRIASLDARLGHCERSLAVAELALAESSMAVSDADVAHYRVANIEDALRVMGAAGPCRVRLPQPLFEDPPRPYVCEDRSSWWAAPLRQEPCYAAELLADYD